MFRAASRSLRLGIPPPPGINYLPPNGLTDFTKSASYLSWDREMRKRFFDDIWGGGRTSGIAFRLPDVRELAQGAFNLHKPSYLQFRAPDDLAGMAHDVNRQLAVQEISWSGFPKSLSGDPAKYRTVDALGADKSREMQDEYCE